MPGPTLYRKVWHTRAANQPQAKGVCVGGGGKEGGRGREGEGERGAKEIGDSTEVKIGMRKAAKGGKDGGAEGQRQEGQGHV